MRNYKKGLVLCLYLVVLTTCGGCKNLSKIASTGSNKTVSEILVNVFKERAKRLLNVDGTIIQKSDKSIVVTVKNANARKFLGKTLGEFLGGAGSIKIEVEKMSLHVYWMPDGKEGFTRINCHKVN